MYHLFIQPSCSIGCLVDLMYYPYSPDQTIRGRMRASSWGSQCYDITFACCCVFDNKLYYECFRLFLLIMSGEEKVPRATGSGQKPPAPFVPTASWSHISLNKH